MQNRLEHNWGTIEVGERLMVFMEVAYAARQSVMLYGQHGIGKSEFLKNAARSMGIKAIVINLSIMEPTDFVGIPYQANGRTVYAPPSFLPDSGKGLLILEELNRAQRYMQNSCLQLLTERKLNEYCLPTGWVPCATANPSELSYFVDKMDDAMTSRWVNVFVRPSETQWLIWGSRHQLHPAVLDYVKNACPFSDPSANPRAWNYAAELLEKWESSPHRNQEVLRALLSGVLTTKWADTFLNHYQSRGKSLTPEQIIQNYPENRATVKEWVAQSRLDQIQSTLWRLQRFLQETDAPDTLTGSENRNIEAFLQEIPSDVLQHSCSCLKLLGLQNFLSDPQTA